jgi:hypothetical protein
MKKIDTRNLVAAAALLAALAATGCTTAGTQHSKVVHNLTPELLSTDQRSVDVQNMTSLTWNTNNRMFWDDLSRAALTDRPSRLSKHPVPY